MPRYPGFLDAGIERLEQAIQRDVANGHIPGGVLGVSRSSSVLYCKAFGKRDADGDAPAAIDTIYPVGSLTKCFIAAAILSVWEDGLFCMNDPITRHLPAFAEPQVVEEVHGGEQARAISVRPAVRVPTIKELFSHTSGVVSGTATLKSHKPIPLPLEIPSWTEELSIFVDKLCKIPLLFDPGTEWRYGQGTQILARMIEVLTGRQLDEIFRKRIAEPLNLNDTSFALSQDQIGRASRPLTSKNWVPPFERFAHGDSGLHTTVGDCLRFLHMLMRGGAIDGARVLSRATVDYALSDHLGQLPRWRFTMPDGEHCVIPEPGFGFGLNFGICVRPGEAYGPVSSGSFYWIGPGPFFHADPKEDLAIVYLLPLMYPQNTYLPGEHNRQKIRSLVYQALG